MRLTVKRLNHLIQSAISSGAPEAKVKALRTQLYDLTSGRLRRPCRLVFQQEDENSIRCFTSPDAARHPSKPSYRAFKARIEKDGQPQFH